MSFSYQLTDKRQTIIKTILLALTAAVSLTMTAHAQNTGKRYGHYLDRAQKTDNRTPIYPRYLDRNDFSKAGLWFWVTEAPPTNIAVNYLDGDDKDSPQKRSFVCVGRLGSNVAIYCVNGPTERDDTLLLEAFLMGYKIGVNPSELTAQADEAARAAASISDQELADAQLRLEAICAMNGGKLPASWPVDSISPQDPRLNPTDAHSIALEKEAQRRLNVVRAANRGQLPADWRNQVAAMGPIPNS